MSISPKAHQSVFKVATQNGYLNVMKWLLYVNYEFYGCIVDDLFMTACTHGHLAIAQWILSVNPFIASAINFHVFQKACFYNQLHIAKWLLSLNPFIDISSNDHAIFKHACFTQSCPEIAFWLQSLKPFLYKITEPVGYRIRTKEETAWQQRKYALWMRSERHRGLLYQIPEDVSRYIVQTFL